ncbi:haloacid dehalogenase-like hydrolase [Yinghuangia seranimata]|uniref:haloacid dehalogenase-like hydrolase n=1 Tax=Yinghuangia seranimata TaxID=408067 RepID=UPI00248CACED|nr:haloacid dehalogenase-like hydrolase [Yinghuangia seranimata]MDI2126125.1 haloacid dehalogenase-like hydrolase [Yinghuangia seranimata]
MRARVRAGLAAGIAIAGMLPMTAATAAPTGHPDRGCPTLDASLPWYGENRAALQAFIDDAGRCGAGHRHGPRPLALFDWDNTVVKNDVGDATTFWLLRHDKVQQPPAKDWTRTSPYLTQAAAAALSAACGTATPAGEGLPTGTDTRCADEILSVYSNGATTGGAVAFDGYDHRRMEPAYAWANQLLAGYTERQVREFAAAARAENLAAPVDATQQVGTHQVAGWVRYYDQQRDLIGTLRRAGFDVRIITASPETVVQVWATSLGFDPDEVVGIEARTRHGKRTYDIPGCGGTGDNSVITYSDGKRCFINQDVLGIRGAKANQQQPADRRQKFAAGDSDTDATFVRDATGLRLAVNRNKTELMCRAYANDDGKWLVNPMFIEPKGKKSSPYPCSTAGYVNPDGSKAPLRDDAGNIVPDQLDTVHG